VNTHLHRRLYAAAFLGSCSYAICRTPLLPLLARDLGATPAGVGLIVGASTVMGILLKLPAGAWSDVFGRRVFLIAAGLVFTLMPLAYLGVASLTMLLALRFVHGSATAIFGPVSAAALSDIAPADRRATWLSTLSMLQGMGQIAAPLIAGVLLSRAGYDAAFVVSSLFALAVPIILWRWPRHEARLTQNRWHAFRGGVAAVVRDRRIVLTSLTQAALLGTNNAVATFVPLYAVEVIGLTPFAVGALVALQALVGIVARPAAGRWSDRFGREPMIVAGLITCGASVACVPLASGPLSLALPVIASAVGVAMATTAASALITDRSRQVNYGAAHGVFGTVYDVGDAMGPIAAGVLVSTIGYSGMFEVAAMVALAAAASQPRSRSTNRAGTVTA
jgi:MFS family permease